MDEGTEEMVEIASAIRIGANAFINYEYKVLLIVTICFSQYLLYSSPYRDRIIIGAVMSAIAGYGMKIATYANVRVK